MTNESVMTYPGFSDERKFVVGLWLRVIAASVFFTFLAPFTMLGIDFPYRECAFAYYGLAALMCSNVVYWYVGKAGGFRITDFYIHWLIDLVLITLVIYGLGGGLLPSAINGYILIVITSAVFISRKASFMVATGAAIAYSSLIAAQAWAIIEPKYNIGGCPQMSAGLRTFLVVGPVFMVYLVAFITGTLGDRLNHANALLSRRNRDLKERNEALDRTRADLEFQGQVLAHDIRSPVSAAYSALAELRPTLEVLGSEEHMRLIDAAARNLDRVEDMIEALQQVSEGSEIGEAAAEVDLGDIVSELRVEFDHQLRGRNAQLVVEGALPVVKGLRVRLLVMLRNLLMNAVRYIPEDGSGLITVGAISTSDEDRIFVRDNGPGIPEEFQKVIFEMFRKAPQESRSPGMGLGLALVRRVAEEHRGRVWVESKVGSGSTFVVALPK
jgi:signal transduction histidine kinase